MANMSSDDNEISLDFRNKTSVITAVKKKLGNEYTSLKKEMLVNIKNDLKFNDSHLKNAKIEVDSKSKTVNLYFPVSKQGKLTLDENLNVISVE